MKLNLKDFFLNIYRNNCVKYNQSDKIIYTCKFFYWLNISINICVFQEIIKIEKKHEFILSIFKKNIFIKSCLYGSENGVHI